MANRGKGDARADLSPRKPLVGRWTIICRDSGLRKRLLNGRLMPCAGLTLAPQSQDRWVGLAHGDKERNANHGAAGDLESV